MAGGFNLPVSFPFLSSFPFPSHNGTIQLPFRDNPSDVIDENLRQRTVLGDISNALPSRIPTLPSRLSILTGSFAERAQGKALQGLWATKANTRLLS
jgi:hypothetical protein